MKNPPLRGSSPLFIVINEERYKEMNKEVLSPIGAMQLSLGVHQRTLRIWDEEGILTPSRSVKNRRMYSQGDFIKAKAIQFMTNEMGLNLQGVKCLLSLYVSEDYQQKTLPDFLECLSLEIGLTPEQMEANKQGLKNRGRKKRIDGGK